MTFSAENSLTTDKFKL